MNAIPEAGFSSGAAIKAVEDVLCRSVYPKIPTRRFAMTKGL
ncbi:hypothetical protein [Dyadobacter fermentans]|nr:hypothetical protein [Dyadobacter fermentans]